MTKKVRKWFWVWQEDKEKAFLEKMAEDGFKLVHVGFGEYIFEEAVPGKRIYQFDFRGITRFPEEEYLQIHKDAGWELAARFGGWYYFVHDREDDADLSLFSNNESKRMKFRHLILFLLVTGFPLYYSAIIMFPAMDAAEFDFLGFYFFFRIVMLVLMVLHLAALIKIYSMYRKLKNHISE